MEKKTVFVTGAATGMGCQTARTLAVQGWKVFAGVLPGQDYEELTAGSGNKIQVVEIDITDDKKVGDAVTSVREAVGEKGLSALINNAGVAKIGAGILEGIPMANAKACFEVNVFGMLRVTQAFLPLLRQYGNARIINLSSGAARVPVPTSGIYNMTKMAVNGMTNTLRMELAPFGIQVVSIEPGAVETPMTAGAVDNLDDTWKAIPGELRAIYEPHLAEANEYLVSQIDKADKPEYIIKNGTLKALTRKNPRPRYTVGSNVKMLPIAQRILSERFFEKILKQQYRIRRK